MLFASAVGVLGVKSPHAMSCPEIPGGKIVAGHASALLQFAIQLVEQVSVDADSGSNREVARRRLAFEILILDSAKRNASNRALCIDCNTSSGTGTQRKPEIVSERIGGADWQNGERDLGSSQRLDNIMNCAIPSANENCVAARGHRHPH